MVGATTVNLKKDTKQELDELMEGTESYDDVVNKVLEQRNDAYEAIVESLKGHYGDMVNSYMTDRSKYDRKLLVQLSPQVMDPDYTGPALEVVDDWWSAILKLGIGDSKLAVEIQSYNIHSQRGRMKIESVLYGDRQEELPAFPPNIQHELDEAWQRMSGQFGW